MAHRIQEKVKQPSIMTGGKLKEYQVNSVDVVAFFFQRFTKGYTRSRVCNGWYHSITID